MSDVKARYTDDNGDMCIELGDRGGSTWHTIDDARRIINELHAAIIKAMNRGHPGVS